MPVRALLVLLIGPLAALAGCGTASLGGLHPEIAQASKELDAAYAESERLGLILTAGQMEGPPIPPERNGAEGLLPVLEKWSSEREAAAATARRESKEPSAHFVLERVPAIDDPMLDQVARLIARPEFRFKRDYTEPFNVPFEELSHLKEAGKAAAWRAMARAQAGDQQGALKDLALCRRIGWAAESEPTLIAGLVGIAIDAIAVGSAVKVAEAWKGQPQALRMLLQTVESTAIFRPLRHVLAGEVYFPVASARNLEAYGELHCILWENSCTDEEEEIQVDTSRLRREGKPESTLGRALLARVLQFWNPHLQDAGMSDEALGRRLKGTAKRIDALAAQPSYQLLAAASVFEQSADAFTKRKVRQHLAVAGIRIMEHRARTGSLPKTLAEAGVAAKEPLLGQDIRYDVQDGAFCLWTPGPDGEDAGSRLREPKGISPDDIHLTWPPESAFSRRVRPISGGTPLPGAPPGSRS